MWSGSMLQGCCRADGADLTPHMRGRMLPPSSTVPKGTSLGHQACCMICWRVDSTATNTDSPLLCGCSEERQCSAASHTAHCWQGWFKGLTGSVRLAVSVKAAWLLQMHVFNNSIHLPAQPLGSCSPSTRQPPGTAEAGPQAMLLHPSCSPAGAPLK